MSERVESQRAAMRTRFDDIGTLIQGLQLQIELTASVPSEMHWSKSVVTSAPCLSTQTSKSVAVDIANYNGLVGVDCDGNRNCLALWMMGTAKVMFVPKQRRRHGTARLAFQVVCAGHSHPGHGHSSTVRVVSLSKRPAQLRPLANARSRGVN